MTDRRSTSAVAAAAATDNPLLAEWGGPYGGVPPFDKVRIADFAPAIERAMQLQLDEIDAIAGDAAAPTFANTIAAMERSGHALNRVMAVYGVWRSTMNSEEFQPVERAMAPKLAAFGDRIVQNAALFARIDAVFRGRADAGLSAEQLRLVEEYHNDFVRAGAALDADAKQRVAAINQELATLFTQFSQLVLADETEKMLVLDAEQDLEGLSPQMIAAAKAAAAARGKAGKWVIANTRSSVDPFLTWSTRRDLRERAWTMFVRRGDNGDQNDTNALIPQILRLRRERAKLLGYPTHADWRLADTMAKTPQRALELMEAVWQPAVLRVHEEVRDMQAVADKEGADLTIAPWDYRHYAEKVRAARYDLDQNEVRQYLQLEQMREAMFWMAGQLFGFAFRQVDGVPVCHPDVRVWEVTDARSKRHVGLWYFDPYARDGKRSGAWMNDYREQSRFDGEITTIVSNNCNFVKGADGEPVLISWDDASTLFHEFGHALHGLCSNVTYPKLAGTSVPRDYVEFPSQLLEHWLGTPEILSKYALHWQTGEPMPKELLQRIENAATFNQGFATVEYLASALVDMRMHTSDQDAIDARTFEKKTLDAVGMPDEIVMRHRPTHFLHIFSSDSYSAGYYSYLWADTLTADAWEAFTEGQGAYDKAVGKRLKDHVFSVGNTVDPAAAYRAFRGRDPEIGALMRKRGFPAPSAPR
ncbi:MAG: M3 family metallopeptidase [Planctomycetota bacterium]